MFEALSAEVVKIRRRIPKMNRAALSDVAAAVGRARGALDALEASVARAVDGLDDDGPGASTVIRSSSRCSQREADKRAKRAAGLDSMPNTTKALEEGRITAEHADALVRAAEETSPEAVDESELIGDAATRPADLTARDARSWANRHRDDSDTQTRHEKQRSRRKLFIFKGDGDMVIIHGEFDSVTGGELETMIEAETNRLFNLDGGRGAAGQVRTAEQRRADALMSLVSGGRFADVDTGPAADPAAGSGGASGRRSRAGSAGAGRRAAGAGGGAAGAGSWRPGPRHQLVIVADVGVVTGDDPGGRSEIAGGVPIPNSVLERLACNSDLFGMIFSGRGQPLWHGRAARTATDAQLRSLVVRDGGCVLCGRAPRWCEAHHVVPWHGPGRGPTDIDNLVLICSHHHHLIHDHRWRLVRSPNGDWGVEPPEVRGP